MIYEQSLNHGGSTLSTTTETTESIAAPAAARDRAGLAERNDAILNTWEAGGDIHPVAAEAGISYAAAHQVIVRARRAGDPRAVQRRPRKNGRAGVTAP